MTHKESKVLLLDDDKNESLSRANSSKRPRTSEDFYKFCTYVLEYAKYDNHSVEEENRPAARTPPPLDSSGSSINSESTSSGLEDKPFEETDTDTSIDDSEESYDTVTCYCRRPFAGRPMIECSMCMTWVHLSCAKIKSNQIPEVFFCVVCKNNRLRLPRGVSSRSSGDSNLKRLRRGSNL